MHLRRASTRPSHQRIQRHSANSYALYIEDPYSNGSRRMVEYLPREKESRSAASGHETSFSSWVYRRSTRSHEPRFQAIQPSVFPAWWISGRSGQWIKPEPPTSRISRCSNKASSIWWQSWTCSRGTCSDGSSRTALIRSSGSMLWRWRWSAVVNQRFSTPRKAASSPQLTLWRGFGPRRSRSDGQAGSVATTTSWWKGCGSPLNTRRCIYVPNAMAGCRDQPGSIRVEILLSELTQVLGTELQ